MDAQQKLDRLTDLLKLDPGNVALRRDCVDAALQSKRFDLALEMADTGLTQTPMDDALRFSKSNALIGRGEYHAAAAVLSELQALHPENSAVAQNLALCEYCIGNFSQARAHLEGLYAAGDRSVGVVRMLVSSCHHLGLMERAVEIADTNKAVGRSDAALAGAYSLLYLDDNRAADAAEFATLSLQGNPRCLDALVTDATLKLASSEIDEATAAFNDILSLQPNNGRAWVGLGSIALLQQDFDEAKRTLTRGLEFMPSHVGSWHLLGWMHFVRNELDDAQKVFERAMELNRNFAETHGALAAIAAIRGETDKAHEMAKVALRLDPDSLAGRFAQSLLAAHSGDQAQAQRLLTDAFGLLAGAGAEKETFKKLMMKSMRGRK